MDWKKSSLLCLQALYLYGIIEAGDSRGLLGHWSHPCADAGLIPFSFPVKAACDMVVQGNLHFNRTHFHKGLT